MKPRAVVLLSLLALAAAAATQPARADDVVPHPASGDRYLAMADRSPFAPPTPVTTAPPPPPPAVGPKWSDQMVVTLLTQQGATYLATIMDKAKGEHYLLQSGREDTEHQLLLTGVTWGESSDLTTVQVSHNGDAAALRFDPSAAASAPVMPTQMPGRPVGAGGMPGMPGGQPRIINPPAPPNPSNVIRRTAPIRTAPTVAAPAVHPPPNVARRPVVPGGKGATDDDDDE